MKYLFILALFIYSCGASSEISKLKSSPTNWILNDEESVMFDDDYGTHYTISETVWVQHPENRYNIILWNFDENYLLAQNDTSNVAEKGLYTRIDFMKFGGMESYTWGFCLTEYAAKSIDGLLMISGPNREHPKTGCNGFPFSRMKKADLR